MGTLHNVTQLRPFVLSGDGAFLPISTDKVDECTTLFNQQMEKQTGLSRVPATIQDVNGQLSICGMNTTNREHEVDASGKFLHVEPGGKHGYGSELVELIEEVANYLGDFWFFVLWGYRYADEFKKSNGQLTISTEIKLPTNEYESFILDRLGDDSSLQQQYLLESGLGAKRWYEADLEEYGPSEVGIIVEEFPDAIEMVKKSLKIVPNDPTAIAALEWYQRHLNESN